MPVVTCYCGGSSFCLKCGGNRTYWEDAPKPVEPPAKSSKPKDDPPPSGGSSSDSSGKGPAAFGGILLSAVLLAFCHAVVKDSDKQKPTTGSDPQATYTSPEASPAAAPSAPAAPNPAPAVSRGPIPIGGTDPYLQRVFAERALLNRDINEKFNEPGSGLQWRVKVGDKDINCISTALFDDERAFCYQSYNEQKARQNAGGTARKDSDYTYSLQAPAQQVLQQFRANQQPAVAPPVVTPPPPANVFQNVSPPDSQRYIQDTDGTTTDCETKRRDEFFNPGNTNCSDYLRANTISKKYRWTR